MKFKLRDLLNAADVVCYDGYDVENQRVDGTTVWLETADEEVVLFDLEQLVELHEDGECEVFDKDGNKGSMLFQVLTFLRPENIVVPI